MNKIYIFITILITISCEDIKARMPLQQNSGSFINTSIEINKHINNKEKLKIEEIVKDPKNNFKASNYGFWYRNEKQKTDSSYTPKFGDQIFYKCAIKNLNGNYIYGEKKMLEKIYIMEQEELSSGLREGLKLMSKGDKMTFIFPSQLAFGFYGDNDKIPPNTPLVYEVNINKIIKNN